MRETIKLCMQAHDPRDYDIMLDRMARRKFAVGGRGLMTVKRALRIIERSCL